MPLWQATTATPRGGEQTPVESLQRRLEAAEVRLAAQELQRTTDNNANQERLIQALTDQSTALTAVVSHRQAKNSTIRIEPKVSWPKLGDDGPGGDEVEEFFKEFERVVSLANDGQGMPDKERLVTLEGCLAGSRLQMYKNVMKLREANGLIGPGTEAESFNLVKARLMKLTQTAAEKQLKAKNEWDQLEKTKWMTALQFEAEWESRAASLEEAGLGKNATGYFLDYIVKVGTAMGENIRMDRRQRPDKSGGTTMRPPETWEEAHAVLREIEGIRAGTKALAGAKAAGLKDKGGADGGKAGGAKGDGKNDGGNNCGKDRPKVC